MCPNTDVSTPVQPDQFVLRDLEFAHEITAEFLDAKLEESRRSWAQLAGKIEKVLVGEYTQFSRLDVKLIEALHLAVLKNPLDDGAKGRSRELSRLGRLVVLAERDQLAQLREIA
jgi:hypothetical protein